MSQHPKAKYLLLGAICLASVWQIGRQWSYKAPSTHVIDPANPPPEFDSKGKVLGNPQNAVSDLASIYKATQIYRKKFGRYPTSSMPLLIDMKARWKEYGLANPEQATLILTNPDIVNSANPINKDPANSARILCYRFPQQRFDKQPLGSPKAAGTRDVLAYTDLYYFGNSHVDWKNPQYSTTNPVGFYIVLWDDGRIERVPFDKALYVPDGKETWGIGFPGQAGLVSGVQTYDQRYQSSPAHRAWRASQTKAS